MSERLPVISGMELVRILKRCGWEVDPQHGSHIMLVHPDFEPTLAVPRHKELVPGTLRKLLKDAHI